MHLKQAGKQVGKKAGQQAERGPRESPLHPYFLLGILFTPLNFVFSLDGNIVFIRNSRKESLHVQNLSNEILFVTPISY